MTVYTELKVVGLKDALKEVQKIDKKLRRQFTRDYKQIVKPVVDDAERAVKSIPDEPMSGWGRSWDPLNRPSTNNRYAQDRRDFKIGRLTKSVKRRLAGGETFQGVLPWDTVAASKMVKAAINTRAVKQYAGRDVNLSVFTIKFLGVANTIFATAGRSSTGSTESGRQMIKVLRERYGPPVRVLWPAYEKHAEQVNKNIEVLVERIMKAANRRLVAER
jgi:hypothetical protein